MTPTELHEEHVIALRAVARDTIGAPACADWRLAAAEKAGLIAFNAWPSGHWTLTPEGRAALAEAA